MYDSVLRSLDEGGTFLFSYLFFCVLVLFYKIRETYREGFSHEKVHFSRGLSFKQRWKILN